MDIESLVPEEGAFTCFFLRTARSPSVPESATCGTSGVYALSGLELGDAVSGWERSLGEVFTTRLESANLFFVACDVAGTSASPILGAPALERLTYFLLALLTHGVPWYSMPMGCLKGTRTRGSPVRVHTHSTLAPVFKTRGAPWVPVTTASLQAADSLAAAFLGIRSASEYRRIRLALGALLRAFNEEQADQRLHQLVRALEGFTFGSNQDRFESRLACLIGNAKGRWSAAYRLRSEVEHLNDYYRDNIFRGLPDIEQRRLAQTLVYETERAACQLFGEILPDPHRLSCFRDEAAIARFWKGGETWAPTLLGDVANLCAGFDPNASLDSD